MKAVTVSLILAALFAGSLVTFASADEYEAPSVHVYVDNLEYRTGDVVTVNGHVEGDLGAGERPIVVVKIFNSNGKLVVTKTFEISQPEMSRDFGFKYTIGGPMDQVSGGYAVVATYDREGYGALVGETTFMYTGLAADSEGWLPFTVEVGAATYGVKYMLPNLVLTNIEVDPEAASMIITVEPGADGRESELSLQYPEQLFPFEIQKVLNDENAAPFGVVGSDEKILTIRTYAYNDAPTKIHVLGDISDSDDQKEGNEQYETGDDYDVTITELSVKDVQGLEITGCANCASSMLMLTAEVKNHLPTPERFVIYLEVRDIVSRYTVYNEFGTGTLDPEGFAEVAISWIPEHPGNYELRSFVFDSLQNTERMSVIETIPIQVS